MNLRAASGEGESGVPDGEMSKMNPERVNLGFESGVLTIERAEVRKVSAAPLIPSSDLYIEVVRPANAGGQHVGHTSTPIKVTHLPTGISATVELRSQHRSRQIAVEMIEAALTSPNFR